MNYKELIDSWYEVLSPFLNSEEMDKILHTIKERSTKVNIFPPQNDTFNAFKQCRYDGLRVVILGMDPYQTKGYAHGLAFSSLSNVTPHSLANIKKEVKRDYYMGLDFSCIMNNDLTNWCKQGVLLLNTALTVEEGKSGSHLELWHPFTEFVMNKLREYPKPLIFLLWGKDAQKYKPYITENKHTILETSHPSPFSVRRGFEGCGHFSQTNNILDLIRPGEKEIQW